jgi:ketosteroid isomerase-like protein
MVTQEMVKNAYAALMSGDMNEIKKHWDENMVWTVPGHNVLSGKYYGLDAFVGFMSNVGAMSANSFNMESITICVNDEYSADVTRNIGYRAGYNGTGTKPYTMLDIDVIHLLRWKDGKVIEGKGAIFGNGTTEYDQFWSPIKEDSNRLD